MDLGNEQTAFVATPEKALLDLVYLQPGGDSEAYLRSLRLQTLERMDIDELGRFADTFSKPKLLRALQNIEQIMTEEAGYEPI